MATPTLDAQIARLSDICQSAWLARPATDSAHRASWERLFRKEAYMLGSTAMKVTQPILVPPFTLAWLAEHNDSVYKKIPMNLEALIPEKAPRQLGPFIQDTQYKFVPVAQGWWTAQGEYSSAGAPGGNVLSYPCGIQTHCFARGY